MAPPPGLATRAPGPVGRQRRVASLRAVRGGAPGRRWSRRVRCLQALQRGHRPVARARASLGRPGSRPGGRRRGGRDHRTARTSRPLGRLDRGPGRRTRYRRWPCPNNLYGLGLGRWLPLVAVAGIGLLVIALALRARDSRERLARLGLATIVASPSTFAHGFLVGLPAFLSLRQASSGSSLGITACSPGLAWWLAPLLGVAAWFAPALTRVPGADRWHPLGSEPAAVARCSAPGPGAVASRSGGRHDAPGNAARGAGRAR